LVVVNWNKILDAMDYAVYVHDVEHIVIDNLQFLLSGQASGFERFEIQDRAVEAFRKFATEKNTHITLVMHPRKQDEDTPLNNTSIFGTAKATQESDNILILQKGKNYNYLAVTKNRFDGELGTIPLGFNKQTNKFYELTKEEVAAVDLLQAKNRVAKKSDTQIMSVEPTHQDFIS